MNYFYYYPPNSETPQPTKKELTDELATLFTQLRLSIKNNDKESTITIMEKRNTLIKILKTLYPQIE